jgi:nucleoside-diphosphate-sugar epimerase
MVIGNGMIAKRFSSYADENRWLVFASGVSHSLSISPEEFKREHNLLQGAIRDNPGKTVVYFSTCSIYDPSLHHSAYVLHKLKMEELITTEASSYIIFRVSNPVGKTNNHHTVLNFFVEHILSETFFTVWKYASRNLVDIDDMFAICNHIMQEGRYLNKIINVANPVNYPVISIIEAIETHLDKKGHFVLSEKGNSPLIDTSEIQPLFSQLHIEFGQHYLPQLLRKYFPGS